DEAKQLFQESLTLSRVSGSQWGMAGAMSQGTGGSAEYTRAKSDFREAMTAYAAALKDPDSREPLLRAFQKLTAVTSNTGDFVATNALFQENLSYFQQSGDTWGEAATMGYMGRVACAAGNYDDAETRLKGALRIAGETGEKALALDIL